MRGCAFGASFTSNLGITEVKIVVKESKVTTSETQQATNESRDIMQNQEISIKKLVKQLTEEQ